MQVMATISFGLIRKGHPTMLEIDFGFNAKLRGGNFFGSETLGVKPSKIADEIERKAIPVRRDLQLEYAIALETGEWEALAGATNRCAWNRRGKPGTDSH